jgi:hypothetical protein
MPEWVTHSRARSFRHPISYGLRDARKKRGSPWRSFLIIFIHGPASKDRLLSSGASSARSLQPQREFDSVPQLDDLCVFLVIKSLSHLENRHTSPPYD